jgi:hypothetical protein
MFWGGKKKEDDKEKQLKHLKAAFPSMRRPNNDDRLFELRFTVDNQYNTLRITVHDDFPQSRPGRWLTATFHGLHRFRLS